MYSFVNDIHLYIVSMDFELIHSYYEAMVSCFLARVYRQHVGPFFFSEIIAKNSSSYRSLKGARIVLTNNSPLDFQKEDDIEIVMMNCSVEDAGK